MLVPTQSKGWLCAGTEGAGLKPAQDEVMSLWTCNIQPLHTTAVFVDAASLQEFSVPASAHKEYKVIFPQDESCQNSVVRLILAVEKTKDAYRQKSLNRQKECRD